MWLKRGSSGSELKSCCFALFVKKKNVLLCVRGGAAFKEPRPTRTGETKTEIETSSWREINSTLKNKDRFLNLESVSPLEYNLSCWFQSCICYDLRPAKTNSGCEIFEQTKEKLEQTSRLFPWGSVPSCFYVGTSWWVRTMRQTATLVKCGNSIINNL